MTSWADVREVLDWLVDNGKLTLDQISDSRIHACAVNDGRDQDE